MTEPFPRQPTCSDCPWRVGSKRFVWSVERFHDLRLGMMQTVQKIMVCHHSNEITCQGFLEVNKTLHLRAWLARARGETNLGTSEHAAFFPSFEAMADANGAGLFDWTQTLEPGDRVVHFKYGLARTALEVKRVHDGIVDTCGNGTMYRFNCLGYELQTVIDSRILPATNATLKLVVGQEVKAV
jgi:Family of unknown function (DUF6283)